MVCAKAMVFGKEAQLARETSWPLPTLYNEIQYPDATQSLTLNAKA